MAPPSLLSMAQRSCIRNIAGLQDVGDVAYELIRPVLKRIDNPQQLRNIEIASPQIADADAELWRAFIARDIPNWEEKIMEPKNPRSWWKVYRKLIREERRAKEEQEEQLMATMMGLDKQKEANQAQIVHKVIPQPGGHKAFADGVPNHNVNSWGQPKQPSLQNAKRGKDILNAIRKQSSNAQQQRGFSQTQPAKAMLPGAKSQIARAPEGMVRDYKKPAPPAMARQQGQGSGARGTPPPRVFVSRRVSTAQDRALKEAIREEQAKKEERLRALASRGAKASPAALPAPNHRLASVREFSTAKPSAPTAGSPSPPSVANSVSPTSKIAALAVAAEKTERLSPSPAPSAKKRAAPAPSIFMPTKKKAKKV